MKKCVFKNFVLGVLVSVVCGGFSMPLHARVPYIKLRNQLPLYFWPYKVPPEWFSFVSTDKERDQFVKSYGIARVPDNRFSDSTFSAEFLYASSREKLDKKSRSDVAAIPSKKRKAGDRFYEPQLFDVYLLRREEKYGLVTCKGNTVIPPVYDQIVFLYGDAPRMGMVVMPMVLVYKGGKYALMDTNGFFVSRFCDRPEDLPSAYVVSAADRFSIKDRVPDKYWGF